MDRAVYATGIDRLIFRRVKPHSLRWAPLFVLAAMIGGYVLMARTATIADPRVMIPRLLIGWLLFYGAYLLAMFLRLFGPRLVATIRQPLDEREAMLKARAGAISGMVLAILAMAGCFYMAGAQTLGWWQPQRPIDWVNLGFGLQGGFLLLPTLIASWLQPRMTADDLE
jgi:peptidoglycan/LPS O-acetylase OafA/YrhL